LIAPLRLAQKFASAIRLSDVQIKMTAKRSIATLHHPRSIRAIGDGRGAKPLMVLDPRRTL